MKQASISKTIRLSGDLYNRISDKAESLGVSFSVAVRILLEAGLKGNIATVDDEIVSGSSDVAMKSAIMALAKAVGDDNVIDEIAAYLGEDTEMFPREEIRKTPKKSKKKPTNIEKPTKPSTIETPKTQDIFDAASDNTENTFEETPNKTQENSVEPISTKEPSVESPAAPTPKEDIPAESMEEEQNYEPIEVSSDTDVEFPQDMMQELSNLIGI